jgi:peptidoglycan/xylan/chitin deacetylase (PgdA/CDA1 family)
MNVPPNIPFRRTLKRAARQVHRCRTIFRKKTMILVYHRVAEAQVDPWGLNVRPVHFAQQLQVLQTIANPISLRDLAGAKSDGDLPARPVCITFDDGYADNLYNAKPALEATQTPGTVFVTTGYLNVPEDLWWDELAKIILDPISRADEVNFKLDGDRYSYALPPADNESGDRSLTWRAWDEVKGPREAAYLAIYSVLVALSDADREDALAQLRQGTPSYADRDHHRCLTDDELRELASGELVEIGAHTLTHPVLAKLGAAEQQREIGGSKRRLEALTGKSVTSFAYPYGKKNHYTRLTAKTVEANGFACACSNFGGLVTRSSNRFALPRFQPMDWDGEQFAAAIEAWYRE